jgi:hypothetical protein
VDGAGGVYVTGYSDGGTGQVNYDYATIKYDAAGAQQWAVRYNGTGNNIDVAVSLALDAQNEVIVSGWSTNTHLTDVDYVTIKYDQQGNSGVTPAVPAADQSLALGPPRPSPFTLSAVLPFRLSQAGTVSLSLWDAAGRQVRTIPQGWMEAGSREAVIPGTGLAPGIYLYRLSAGSLAASGKLVRR